MMKRIVLLSCLLAWGCEDVAPGIVVSDMSDMDPRVMDMGPPEADAEIDEPDAEVVETPETAYVELALQPRRAIYGLDETPVVVVTAYDRIGREIPNAAIYLDVQPEGAAEIDDERRLTFLAEGQGAVRGCARPGVCGRTSFYVDAGPPSLEIIQPARAAYLSGEPIIEIIGRTDVDPSVRVFINEQPVAVDDEGGFTHRIPAEFGLNRIDVIADDGVRRPAPRAVREVMWAPEYVMPRIDGVDLVDAVVMRLGQHLLDAGEAIPDPDPDGVLVLSDLASLIEVIIGRSSLLPLLEDNLAEDSDNMTLRIEDVSAGAADITVLLVPGGLEVFVRFEGMSLDTSGEFRLEGQRFDLGGRVTIDAAAFVRLALINGPDQAPVLDPTEVDVAIEALNGDMNDSTVQALIDTIGSALQGALQRFASDLVHELMEEEIPGVIELGLDDVLEPLRSTTISIDNEDFLPSVDVNIGLLLNRTTIEPRTALSLYLNASLDIPDAVEAPHPTEGIPTFGEGLAPIWPARSDIALAFRVLTFNGLLDALWRKRLFQLDLSSVIPEQFAAVSAARLDSHLPPVVVPAPIGSPNPLIFQLGETFLEVESMFNPEPDIYAMSVRVGVVFVVDRNGARFILDDRPDIRFELVQAGGEQPFLPPEVFEQLFTTSLWPEFSDSFGSVLEVTVPPILLDIDALADLAPDINTIGVTPVFPEQAAVRNGWVVLSADATLRVE